MSKEKTKRAAGFFHELLFAIDVIARTCFSRPLLAIDYRAPAPDIQTDSCVESAVSA